MRLTYNPELDIADLYLRDGDEEVTTLTLSADLHIDIAPDGRIYGIELLSAHDQLFSSDGNLLEFVNQISGEKVELALPV
jgi:uncharacterized protein YuzE